MSSETKNKNGRPTKLTDEVVVKMVAALELGMTYEHACAYAGVSYPSFCRWRNIGEEDRERNKKTKYAAFLEAITQAEMDAVQLALKQIQKSILKGDANQAMRFLSLRYPQYYGVNRHEVTGKDGKDLITEITVNIVKKE